MKLTERHMISMVVIVMATIFSLSIVVNMTTPHAAYAQAPTTTPTTPSTNATTSGNNTSSSSSSSSGNCGCHCC